MNFYSTFKNLKVVKTRAEYPITASLNSILLKHRKIKHERILNPREGKKKGGTASLANPLID